jgi:hypothetical protein
LSNLVEKLGKNIIYRHKNAQKTKIEENATIIDKIIGMV